MSFTEFEQARDTLRTGAEPADDNVPTELLACISPVALHAVYCSFVDRLAGKKGSTEKVEAWSHFVLFCIHKKSAGENMDKWRGLCLSASLFKWYEVCLWMLLDRTIKPSPPWLCGFRKGRQVLDFVGGIVSFLRRSHEWKLQAVVVSLDIRAAFDNMQVHITAEALARRGACHILTASLAREWTGLSATPPPTGWCHRCRL